MEPYFEVTTCVEKAHYVEFYKLAMPRRMLSVVVCGVMGVWLLVQEFLRSGVNFGLLGVAILIIAAWTYRRPWDLAATAVAQEKAFSGAEQKIVNVKFGEEIEVVSARANSTVAYDKIMKIHNTPSAVYLYDVRNAVIIVDKNGFTKGNFEEFRQFMQEKRPQLKFPQK